MLGDNDKKEVENLREELKLSEQLSDKLKYLELSSKELEDEYKDLLKTGKKLHKVIKKKEKRNEKEMEKMNKLHNSLRNASVDTIKNSTMHIKETEIEERNMSRKEAQMLQQMLQQLQGAHQKSKSFASLNLELYTMMKEIYAKDLSDYQLEVEDLNKA